MAMGVTWPRWGCWRTSKSLKESRFGKSRKSDSRIENKEARNVERDCRGPGFPRVLILVTILIGSGINQETCLWAGLQGHFSERVTNGEDAPQSGQCLPGLPRLKDWGRSSTAFACLPSALAGECVCAVHTSAPAIFSCHWSPVALVFVWTKTSDSLEASRLSIPDWDCWCLQPHRLSSYQMLSLSTCRRWSLWDYSAGIVYTNLLNLPSNIYSFCSSRIRWLIR